MPASSGGRVQVEEAEDHEAHDRDRGADPEAAVHVLEGDVGGVVGLGAHRVGGDDRAEDADAAHEEREHDADVAEGGQAQDHRRDDRDLVGLEDVRRHSGAVADVVADVVRDGRRVAGIVLGDALLDLADEVGADVGGLGVDAAAHAHEEREEGAAEAEAEEGLVGRLAEGHEDQRAAEEAEAVGEHARDGAGAVAELEGVAVAVAGGGRYAEVALRGEAHADEADEPAEGRAEEEGERAAPVEPGVRARGREVQEDRDDDHEGRDLLELGAEVGVGPLAHGLGDLLHLLGALVGLADLADEHQGVQEARLPRSPSTTKSATRSTRREGGRGIEEGKGLEWRGLARRRSGRGLGAEEGDEDRQAEEDDEGHREAAAAFRLRPALRDPII